MNKVVSPLKLKAFIVITALKNVLLWREHGDIFSVVLRLLID